MSLFLLPTQLSDWCVTETEQDFVLLSCDKPSTIFLADPTTVAATTTLTTAAPWMSGVL